MQNIWQKKIKLNYSQNVIDIIQFGSSLKNNLNPNDIDIAVIFEKISLRDQLDESQQIKKQLEKLTQIPIHINSFDLYSLFDKSNFAKEGILFYGKSLITGDDFAKKFRLNPRVQIYYSLEKLKKKDKVRFNYMLNGKKGEYGLLREYGGRLLKPGLIEIESLNEEIFVKAIKEIISDFKVKKIFEVI